MNDNGPKCERCKRTVIKLIKEQVPLVILRKYHEGLCRDCKRAELGELSKLLR